MIDPGPRTPCSIIIVNFNGKHLLRDCLTSVEKETTPDDQVILVDNGSSDGSKEFVEQEFPRVRVIRSAENLGYAGGNNLGVRQAIHDAIVLLNNDTIVQPGWLAALLAPLERADVGIASSLVLTGGIPDAYYERNGSLNLIGHNIMRVFEHPENIFYGGGASLAFKRSLFDVPFDEDYFAYGEDVYLGLRARFLGLNVVHVNASVVLHLGSATARKGKRARMGMLQERNRILNILLFFSGGTLIRLTPLLILNVVGKIAASVAGRYSLQGVLWAYLWLASHPGLIRRKRGMVQKDRRTSDAEVLSWMTSKLTNGDSFLNTCTHFYCRAVGIKTMEDNIPGSR